MCKHVSSARGLRVHIRIYDRQNKKRWCGSIVLSYLSVSILRCWKGFPVHSHSNKNSVGYCTTEADIFLSYFHHSRFSLSSFSSSSRVSFWRRKRRGTNPESFSKEDNNYGHDSFSSSSSSSSRGLTQDDVRHEPNKTYDDRVHHDNDPVDHPLRGVYQFLNTPVGQLSEYNHCIHR